MEKNSDFIRNKEFHIVFKGYKPEEVDKFLDTMSVEFDRLIKSNKELQESLDKLKFEGTVETEDSDMKKIIQDALVSAHKVAEDIKNQAKKEAEELLGKRQLEEETSLEKLKNRKLKLEESIIVLQTRYSEFKNKLRKTAAEINQFVGEADHTYTTQEDIPEEAGKIDKETEKVAFDDSGPEEVKVEEAKEPGEVPLEVEQEKVETKTDEVPEEKPTRYLSNFENFKIQQNRESGFYFDKPPEESKNQEKESRTLQGEEKSTDKGPDEKGEYNPKRERKKIDIANPDIIENFFKASDD